MRQQQSLNGPWRFQLDPVGSIQIDSLAPDREIPVPLPWQAAFPELRLYSGYAWYQRTFDLAESWLQGEVLLHFGAVDYWCQVYVNGQLAGEHEGGYTPITLPIRAYVQAGHNTVAVRVYDTAQEQITIPRRHDRAVHDPAAPPFDPNNIPHGKQEWYINVGGIWQDVTLTAVSATYIDYIHVTPDIHAGQARVRVALAGAPPLAGAGPLQMRIEAEGRPVVEATIDIVGGQTAYEATLTIPAPRLWDVDDPYLYTATVTAPGPGGPDMLAVRFGLREITSRDGQLLLNDAPLFLLSALDQDLYPDTIYTVPSEEFLRDQFAKAKALGLNNLRCHIKPPDPRYLDLADEMGLLVWAEIPSWRTFWTKGTLYPEQLALPDTVKARVRQTLEEMIRRDFNHPALIIWTIVNEDWGTALPLSAADRAWVAEMYAACKALDPTRLVVDNSPCPHPWGPNIHVASDIDDFHIYANIPDQALSFERTIEQFGLRPLWTYSSLGDAHRTGREPLILSEFGNWGLPSLQSLRAHHGGEPPWFDIGPWWSSWDGEAGWPAGTDARFAALGLDAIWEDYEAFVTATQWHQFAALKFEIEAMRRQPALAGYVITEFTDAYWESNGLLDFGRAPKAYHDRFAIINAPDVVLPRLRRYACWDDQPIAAEVFGAHYSPADWAGARLHWTLADRRGADAAPLVARGAVESFGRRSWPAPPSPAARLVPLEFVLQGTGERVLARNATEVLVLPAAARAPGYTDRLAVICEDVPGPAATQPPGLPVDRVVEPQGAGTTQEDETLAAPDLNEWRTPDLTQLVQRLDYRITRRVGPETAVAITNYPTAALLQWVRAGGDLLFLCSGPSPFFWVQGRGGTYGGSWLTSFSWVRPEVHRRLPITNPLGLPFMAVMPLGVILGLPVYDRAVQRDFLAGQVSGWVGHPALHTVQFRYGRGRVVMTTFAIERALANQDPVAVALFHDLIDYLHSDTCRPTLTANY